MTEQNPQRFERGHYLEFKSVFGPSDVTRSGKPVDPVMNPPGTSPSPFLHAYIVYRDGKGGEQVFRGGPAEEWMDNQEGWKSPFGHIQTQVMPLLKEDGIAGPKTRRALRFATQRLGADNLLSGFAGLFRDG